MGSDTLKNQFMTKYLVVGPHKFFNFILVQALNKLVMMEKGTYKGINPDLEFLEYHDKLIILYRREGDENLLEAARLFRKAAHRIYRVMLKKNLTPYNGKFLNLVKKCQS